ncbi:MAG: MFS transporter [Verrucomicrobiota bacterium]
MNDLNAPKHNAFSTDGPGIGKTEQGSKGWLLVLSAAVVMLATLPGRTQGLGLITEPLLNDLHIDRVLFANINLWASLIGAVFCIPAGILFDRYGLRWPTAIVTALLAIVVGAFSLIGSSVILLFLLLTATRGLGQSALSVASITAVGRRYGNQAGMPMAIFSVLISVFFALAFVGIGYGVRLSGWRSAWQQVAAGLVVVAIPIILLFFKVGGTFRKDKGVGDKLEGATLLEALSTPAFWIFALSAALFNFVSSGLGLFNENVLAEQGFDQKTFHLFLGVTTLLSLVGQFLAGWLSRNWSYRAIIVLAMALYAAGLASIPSAHSITMLYGIAFLVGISGGMIIVVFFAVWSDAFGRRQLGHIQGAAQLMTVVSSAIGPVVFARAHELHHSYKFLLYVLAAVVLGIGLIAARVPLPHSGAKP